MSAIIEPGRIGAQELQRQLGPTLYREAYKAGRSLSVHLEMLDPSSQYNDGLDAFSRQLKLFGVISRSRPEMGLFASPLDDLAKTDEGRALIPELFSRMWREAVTGKSPDTRSLYTTGDDLPGSAALPTAYAQAARVPRRRPPLTLAELIAITTPVTSGTYEAYYLTADASNSRMSRVVEGNDIPLMRLTGGDHAIKLKKYGGGIAASYEVLRRTRIDKIALWMAQVAIQTEMDRISHAIKVLVDGDGNSGTAATNHDITDLDATATGYTVTLKGYQAFKLKFSPSYQMTHLIGAEADVLKVMLLSIGTGGDNQGLYLAAIDQELRSGLMLRDGVKAGITADTPANGLVGIDASAALEWVYEAGSNIEEVEKFSRNQTQAIIISEVEEFAVFDQGATKTLTLENS